MVKKAFSDFFKNFIVMIIAFKHYDSHKKYDLYRKMLIVMNMFGESSGFFYDHFARAISYCIHSDIIQPS